MKHVGIDISKSDFWVCIGSSHKVFLQTDKGFSSYLRWLDGINMQGAIHVMEATGVYHLRLAMFLRDHDLPVAVVNPQRPYHHGRSQMTRVVNDASAARNIADFAEKNKVTGDWEPMPDEIEQLRWWLGESEKIAGYITVCTNRLESLKMRPSDTKDRQKYLKNEIEDLRKKRLKADAKAAKIVSQHHQEEMDLFLSIPGVGPKTSQALIAFFCSHYHIAGPRQALVLAGLSLKRHTSGTSVNKTPRITKMGYGYLRKLLYLGALTASKYNPACAEFYDKLVADGKKKKVALIAVACKILRQAFAIWSKGEPFNEEKSKDSFVLKTANA